MNDDMNRISEKSCEDSQERNNNKLDGNDENQLYNDLLKKFQSTQVVANGSDYYPNAIPLGAFCLGVSLLLYGFKECIIHEVEDIFLYIVIFFFGGIGQLTAGIFEFIKNRIYPATLYITYGLYFLSLYVVEKYTNGKSDDKKEDILKIYFGSWAFLSAPIIILSVKINLFYLIQNAASVAFFVIKCIGWCGNSDPLKEIVSGILESVAGVVSLYICYGQILNNNFGSTLLPTIPFKNDNDIDNFPVKTE